MAPQWRPAWSPFFNTECAVVAHSRPTLSLMDALADLHQRLRVAASLLDGAASQIREIPLSPTSQHIHSIGEALVSIFEIQSAIHQLRPELVPEYDEPPEEVRAANRRLGEVLVAAYDLADSARVADAISMLKTFAATEPSEQHRAMAASEVERLSGNYET